MLFQAVLVYRMVGGSLTVKYGELSVLCRTNLDQKLGLALKAGCMQELAEDKSYLVGTKQFWPAAGYC